MVEQVAARAGLKPEDVAELEERVPTFVERLARTLAAATPELFPRHAGRTRMLAARGGGPRADHRNGGGRDRGPGEGCAGRSLRARGTRTTERCAAREARRVEALSRSTSPLSGFTSPMRRRRRFWTRPTDARAIQQGVLSPRLERSCQLSHGAQHRGAGDRRGGGGDRGEGAGAGVGSREKWFPSRTKSLPCHTPALAALV